MDFHMLRNNVLKSIIHTCFCSIYTKLNTALGYINLYLSQ